MDLGLKEFQSSGLQPDKVVIVVKYCSSSNSMLDLG